MSVRVGQNRGAGLGADTLLDFSVETTLDGKPLTEAEWQSLLQAADGLALVRGQWVEVDPEKLRDALAHWKKVESMSRRGGLTFFERMRLISGFQPGAAAAEEGAALGEERDQAVGVNWLGFLARPYILRRLKTDKRVIADLPEKTEVRAWCSLTKPQAALRLAPARFSGFGLFASSLAINSGHERHRARQLRVIARNLKNGSLVADAAPGRPGDPRR